MKHFKVGGQNQDQHPEVFPILTCRLVEVDETMAFAPKKKDRIQHSHSVEEEGAFVGPHELLFRNTENVAEKIDAVPPVPIQMEDAQLSIRGRAPRNKFAFVRFPEIPKGRFAHPDVAIERGEGTIFIESLIDQTRILKVVGPEV